MNLPVASLLLALVGAAAGGEPQRPPKPAEFANVFSFGYGGDTMPKDDARFAALLAAIKAAGFNAVFIANHNTYAAQDVTLTFSHRIKATAFNRKTGRWQPLTVRRNAIRFPLAPAAGELLRLEK